jgi:hypothetical protein
MQGPRPSRLKTDVSFRYILENSDLKPGQAIKERQDERPPRH